MIVEELKLLGGEQATALVDAAENDTWLAQTNIPCRKVGSDMAFHIYPRDGYVDIRNDAGIHLASASSIERAKWLITDMSLPLANCFSTIENPAAEIIIHDGDELKEAA